MTNTARKLCLLVKFKSHQLSNLKFMLHGLHTINKVHQIRIGNRIKSVNPNKIYKIWFIPPTKINLQSPLHYSSSYHAFRLCIIIRFHQLSYGPSVQVFNKSPQIFSTEKLNAICCGLSCVVFHFIGKRLCINLILNTLLIFTRLISQQGSKRLLPHQHFVDYIICLSGSLMFWALKDSLVCQIY